MTLVFDGIPHDDQLRKNLTHFCVSHDDAVELHHKVSKCLQKYEFMAWSIGAAAQHRIRNLHHELVDAKIKVNDRDQKVKEQEVRIKELEKRLEKFQPSFSKPPSSSTGWTFGQAQ